MDIKTRIRGAFTGFIFGSAVNKRFAPMITPEEARKRFGNKTFSETPKDYTLYDQYTKAKILYDILLRYGKISPEIHRDYFLDLHKRDNVFRDKVYGPSTQRAVKAILNGEDIYEIGKKGITCGGAFSGLPIGMYFYNDIEKLIENTANSCVISHNTDVVIDAAIAINVTLATLLNGMEKFKSINEGIRISKEYHGKFGAKTSEPKIFEQLEEAVELLKGKTLDEAMLIIPDKFGVGWDTKEAIPASFANFIVVDNPNDACLLSIRCGGDIDTFSDISCTFLGAEKGPEIFSKEILRKIEEKNKINVNELIDKLLRKMNM